jgi:hypothetical protein
MPRFLALSLLEATRQNFTAPDSAPNEVSAPLNGPAIRRSLQASHGLQVQS